MGKQQITLIGAPPLEVDDNGNLLSRIGTLFLNDRVLITLPGMTHAEQRLHYLKQLNENRKAQGEPAIEPEYLDDSVDLIMEGASVLIRPESSLMGLALEADTLLQTIAPKQNIRFLCASEKQVREAIRMRGEYWRISPHPKAVEEVMAAIEQSKIAIGGLSLYYYNPAMGTRHLTLQAFSDLRSLPPESLRQHLLEIQEYSMLRNRHGRLEVALFGLKPGCGFKPEAFTKYEFKSADADQLHAWHQELCVAFETATEEKLRHDSVTDAFWRNHMFTCLADERNKTVIESPISELPEEFFRQIEWLPGGRISSKKELIFDPVFDEPGATEAELCDTRVKGFIFNYVREFGDLEYVNIGRLLPGLRNHVAEGAHRAYIAEVKHRNAPEAICRILRVQKWGITERLAKGHDLLHAIMETQEYTEYTLDRRLGCWELNMPLVERYDMRVIFNEYKWDKTKDGASRIWTTYYERDFIKGLATDKVLRTHLENTTFAIQFAQLLGRTAAPNMVVGRMTPDKQDVIFDQGDEMLRLNELGLPVGILVADHAGTFTDYKTPLVGFAKAYARPVLSRIPLIPIEDRSAFAEAYLANIEVTLVEMQEKYKRYKQGFDTLFQHSKQGEESFPCRWAKVLERLKTTDAKMVVAKIREVIDANKGNDGCDA